MRQLKELSEFNQAIVYSFEPEAVDGLTQDQASLSVFGQYADILDAYLYAQDEVLPTLKSKGLDQITPELLISFLKQIHKRLGNSLLSHKEGVKSGEYLDSLVVHWNHGGQMQSELAVYLLGLNPACKTEEQMLAYCAQEYPFLDKWDVLQFIHLLQKMINDQDGLIHPSYRAKVKMNDKATPFFIGLCRLATAFHEKKLTMEEQKLVSKFVVFVPYPHLIEPLIMSLAKKISDKWKSIDTDNLNEFSLFLADIYHELVSIHPFFNANKRTARCWINIMLRFSGYPDIMLTPRDIITMDHGTGVQILAEDIRNGIIRAKSPSPDDTTLKTLLEVRLAILDCVKQIMTHNPQFSITQMVDDICREYPLILLLPEEQSSSQLLVNQLMLVKVNRILTALQHAASNASNNTKTGFFFSEKLDLTGIKSQLKDVFGVDNWKISINGSIWVEFENLDEAKSLFLRVQEKQFGISSLKKIVNQDVFAVRIDSVDVNKLAGLEGSFKASVEQKP